MDDRQSGRRSLIFRGVAWFTAAGLVSLVAHRQVLAQSKLNKEAVKYQDKPQAGKDCDDCMHFIPGTTAGAPGECKVVEGPVSPHGYCLAFTAKRRAATKG